MPLDATSLTTAQIKFGEAILISVLIGELIMALRLITIVILISELMLALTKFLR